MPLTHRMILTGTTLGAAGALAAPAGAQTIDLSVTIPRLTVAEYHKPYVAIWVEPAGGGARTLAVWYDFDMRNGEGNFRWSNGDKYAGEFKDDVRDGQGTYWYSDGSKYTGKYKDDMRNGQGTYSYADGSTYTGEYKYDMRHGFGIFESPDGSKLTGEWKSDVLVP